ncbi:group XIIB secretory phospholipase A2-like protein isoform X2 [Gouania willdenowi]|uniref:Group XIIB secretory phospholipase A2-like protein n=1 Tax=Gouania willdenowi TaxID=441366 RepID=A0A8C5HJA2_GOUWI|nr:group XIIB secretory phospholipase A2-like protein isoform X2 [Gouania willdenowi]
MFLRTQVLLLLLVSSGMCATLGYYQAEDKEKEKVEAPALESAAAVSEADEGGAAAVATDVDVLPPAEAAAVETPYGEKLLGEILEVDKPAVEEPKVDVEVTDSETVEESEADQQSEEHDNKEHRSPEANEIQPVQTTETPTRAAAQPDDNSWSLSSIRNTFQTAHGYFDSLVELVGGHNGVCQYRCRHGELPQPRPGYQLPEPNGCSSSLVGFQLDLGIPAMTKCCNLLDTCYDTCGTSKYDCDSKFRLCLHDICSDLKKSLGFESKVQACESMADALYNTVWTLGCRPYMNSQRAACVCSEEEKDEL